MASVIRPKVKKVKAADAPADGAASDGTASGEAAAVATADAAQQALTSADDISALLTQ
jgi:hypothetical protein